MYAEECNKPLFEMIITNLVSQILTMTRYTSMKLMLILSEVKI
jgi:hypothetical protein